jgi:hypothetical protein
MKAAVQQIQIDTFQDVETVVEDSLRFKLKLGIGENAYSSLRITKKLLNLWDGAGVAAAGAGLAASSTVAGTFFGTTGFWASIGLGGAAVTPVGWVIAAGATAGGAYYGVTRLFQNFAGDRVLTIPSFINTPVDILGVNLFDLMVPLALRIAQMDGEVCVRERDVIQDYFVREWGYSVLYCEKALALIERNTNDQSIEDIVNAIANFKLANPDCNYPHMTRELGAVDVHLI